MCTSLDPDEMPPWLSRLFKQRPHYLVAGVNDDDCAVVRLGNRLIVFTTDFLNAKPIALELGIGTNRDLGRLLVAANLSDLCGSGAEPVGILVSVTLPYGTTISEFKQLMRGIAFEARRHKVPVIGGDTKLGPARALAITAIGMATKRSQLFLKSDATPGEIIWASGPLGSAAAAAWGFNREGTTAKWRGWAKRALIAPRLPLLNSRKVALGEIGGAGTDISDGLGVDLHDLCSASGVGCIIDAEKIPLEPETRMMGPSQNAWRFAFISGGDFQFVVTTKKVHRRTMERLGFAAIGVTTEKRRYLLRTPAGEMKPLPVFGHRDARRLSFANETDQLLRQLTKH